MIQKKHFNNNSFLLTIIILFQSSIAFSASELNFAPEENVSDSYRSACDTTSKFSVIGHSPLCEIAANDEPGSYKKLVEISGGAVNSIEVEMGNVDNNYDGKNSFQNWWDGQTSPIYKRLGEPEPCLAELFKSPEMGFSENWSLTRIGSCSKNKTVNINKSMCTNDGGTWELVRKEVYNYYIVNFTGDSAKSSCTIERAKSVANHAGSDSLSDLNKNDPAIIYHTGRINGNLPPPSEQKKIPVLFVDKDWPFLYYK